MTTIAVDAMGGDYAPRAVVEGAVGALDELDAEFQLLLVGDREKVEAELARLNRLADPRLEVIHASEVVHMDESASVALRSKKGSSINVAVDLVKAGRAQAVVSAGHTGATVASAVVKLRPLPTVGRPGIGAVFPSRTGHFVLLDAGSTIDCKPIHLVHYAVMGDTYEQHILGKRNPRIGLLNIGGEHSKGNDLTKEAFKLLSGIKELNFIGNVEGHDLFGGNVDVVICDGFVGNIVLKTCESLAGALGSMLKESICKSAIRKLGYLFIRNAFKEVRQKIDHVEYGGAPLLGVNGVCIIAHGSSSSRALLNAIRVADEFVAHQVNQRILERIEALGLTACNT